MIPPNINYDDWVPMMIFVLFTYVTVLSLKSLKRFMVNGQPEEIRSMLPELDVMVPHNKMGMDPLEGDNKMVSELHMTDDEGYIN